MSVAEWQNRPIEDALRAKLNTESVLHDKANLCIADLETELARVKGENERLKLAEVVCALAGKYFNRNTYAKDKFISRDEIIVALEKWNNFILQPAAKDGES
jgi:hypothetical protein